MINLHNDHISLEISHIPLVLFNEYFIFDWDKELVFQCYVLSSEAIWVTRTLWLCKVPQSEVQRIILSVFSLQESPLLKLSSVSFFVEIFKTR